MNSYRYTFEAIACACQSDVGKTRNHTVVAYCEAQALAWVMREHKWSHSFRLVKTEVLP